MIKTFRVAVSPAVEGVYGFIEPVAMEVKINDALRDLIKQASESVKALDAEWVLILNDDPDFYTGMIENARDDANGLPNYYDDDRGEWATVYHRTLHVGKEDFYWSVWVEGHGDAQYRSDSILLEELEVISELA